MPGSGSPLDSFCFVWSIRVIPVLNFEHRAGFVVKPEIDPGLEHGDGEVAMLERKPQESSGGRSTSRTAEGLDLGGDLQDFAEQVRVSGDFFGANAQAMEGVLKISRGRGFSLRRGRHRLADGGDTVADGTRGWYGDDGRSLSAAANFSSHVS